MRKSRRVFSEAQTRVMQHMVAHARSQSFDVLASVITKPHSGSYSDDGTRKVIQPRATLASLVRKGMIQTDVPRWWKTYTLTPKGKEVAIRYATHNKAD